MPILQAGTRALPTTRRYLQLKSIISQWRSTFLTCVALISVVILSAVGACAHSKHESCQPPFFKFKDVYRAPSIRWYEFKDTCIDQGTFIVHDKALIQRNPLGSLPSLDVNKVAYHFRHHNPWSENNKDPVYGSAVFVQQPTVRAPTAKEWQAHTYFSNCTLPLIFYQNWPHNLGEFFQRAPNTMFHNIKWGFNGRNLSLVLAMPASLPVPPFNKLLLAPFTQYEVTSLASFSSRAPPNTPSRATWEGTHVRCFSRLVVCVLLGGRYPDMYDTAQAVYRHYRKQLPPASPDGGPLFKGGNDTLKVLLEIRGGGMREVLNAEQLEEEVSSRTEWPNITAASGGGYNRVELRRHTFGANMLRDIAIMREVDVLVVPHGAGATNGLFMREHASLIELRPHEFGTKYTFMAHMVLPPLCDQNQFKLLCWFMSLEGEGLWSPGVLERTDHMIYNHSDPHLGPHMKARDRNMVLPLWMLEHVLSRVVAVGGNLTAYKAQWDAKQVSFLFENGTVTAIKQHFK